MRREESKLYLGGYVYTGVSNVKMGVKDPIRLEPSFSSSFAMISLSHWCLTNINVRICPLERLRVSWNTQFHTKCAQLASVYPHEVLEIILLS